VTKNWNREGEIVKLKLPTYAIARGQRTNTERALNEILDRYRTLLLSELQCGQDDIIQQTLQEANRQAQQVS
jgi:hypothetical protein